MDAGVRAYFEQRAHNQTWSSLYDGTLDARTYNFLTRREAVLRLLEPEGSFGRVLDVGCGTGDYAPVAWRHGGTYYGVDFSTTMITQAKARLDGRGGSWQLLVGSGDALPYCDNGFDLVLAIGYLEYFRDPSAPIREIRRVLKPGGMLVMQSYKRELCGNLYRVLVHPLRLALRRFKGQDASSELPLGVDRPYSQRHLDAFLREFGFVRTGYVFNHFVVLPDPLRARVPRIYVRLSEAMSRSPSRWWSLLAVNYIGKYRLRKDSGGIQRE